LFITSCLDKLNRPFEGVAVCACALTPSQHKIIKQITFFMIFWVEIKYYIQ
jgi:hypothetical protein